MAKTMTTQEKDRAKLRDAEWAKGILASLALRSFHGKITINYADGRIRNLMEEKSHKPPA